MTQSEIVDASQAMQLTGLEYSVMLGLLQRGAFPPPLWDKMDTRNHYGTLQWRRAEVKAWKLDPVAQAARVKFERENIERIRKL